MKTAKDPMITKLVTLDPATPVLQSIQKLIDANIKDAPVVSPGRNYLGIFTERCCLDVLTRLFSDHGSADIAGAFSIRSSDCMTSQLWLIRPEMDAFDAVNFLLSRRISGAPVVDGKGRFLGVFSESQGMRVLIGAVYDNLPGRMSAATWSRTVGASSARTWELMKSRESSSAPRTGAWLSSAMIV